jgi:hypothetical protein
VNEFRLIIAGVSAVGLLAGAVWHAAVLAHVAVPELLERSVLSGLFVVWIPTVFQVVYDHRTSDSSNWRSLLWRGAPRWLVVLAAVAFAYGMGNFVITAGFPATVGREDPEWARVASGVSLVFYSQALLVMAAALGRREKQSEQPGT